MLEDDVIKENPSFLKLTAMLEGCSKRYERFCQHYCHDTKGASILNQGPNMLMRLLESRNSNNRMGKNITGDNNSALLLISVLHAYR